MMTLRRACCLFSLILAVATEPLQGEVTDPTKAFTTFAGPGKLTLPFTVSREGKPVIAVQLMGQPRQLFVDTGATTLLDVGVARELGLHPMLAADGATGLTGVAGQRWLAVVTLKLGDLTITDYPISCLDLSALRALNQSQGLPALDGLIGADLLLILRARLDYGTRELTIRRPTAAQLK